MPYELTGRFIEACDCKVLCPCWIEEAPDEDECTGLFVWEVDRGAINGVNVSGLRIASVSFHTGDRKQASQRVAMFIDEKATEDQHEALVEVFSGTQGGTLAELGKLLGELVRAESAKIDIDWTESGAQVTVGANIKVDLDRVIGATGRPITVVDSALGRVLGSPAQVAKSRKLQLDIPSADIELDLKGRSATEGVFNYRG